jgi:hypothetical protein
VDCDRPAPRVPAPRRSTAPGEVSRPRRLFPSRPAGYPAPSSYVPPQQRQAAANAVVAEPAYAAPPTVHYQPAAGPAAGQPAALVMSDAALEAFRQTAPVSMAAGAVYLCISHPMLMLAIPMIIPVMWVLNAGERRRQRRIAIERQDESICSFARSFDCRATDTWIIRAVFEEVSIFVQFPLRADDRLEADLKIDPEDIEDIVEAIAQRTGRPLEDCEANPLHGKVTTVRELVEYFVNQVRRSRPAA